MQTRRAFTLLELMICLVIISLLIGILMPLFVLARDGARITVCASNLKNIGLAWQQYLNENKVFPTRNALPDWHYGGASFAGNDGKPRLAVDRPLNTYINATHEGKDDDSTTLCELFHCPCDNGLISRDRVTGQTSFPIGDRSCFSYFGNSYRANPELMNGSPSGSHNDQPMRMSEVSVPTTKLVLVGDAEWYYATRGLTEREAAFDASWHKEPNGANVAFVDGSVQFLKFSRGETRQYLIHPKLGH
ncbi:MAG: type II secretion system protein [Phycisphaeraceae bacterium]|nr:type II secretion system protein [Phycisphaerales bacterium]MCB9859542.1 type II secretion system protein [Phycisphaeraceae bacterium]